MSKARWRSLGTSSVAASHTDSVPLVCHFVCFRKESFGMGVLETMSFGKPVVATGVGGVSEIVLDGETGFLAKLGDVRSMAQKVRKLAADPALAGCMGQAAQARARQEFSAEKSVGRYLDYYHSVLDGCGCGAQAWRGSIGAS